MWLRLDEDHFRTIVINPEKPYRFAADVMSEDNIPPLQPAPGAASEIAHAVKAFPDNCILKLDYADFDGTKRFIRKKYRCAVG